MSENIQNCITACQCAAYGEPKLSEWADKAQAELTALLADRARLEWLETQIEQSLDDVMNGEFHITIKEPEGNLVFRAAIDAAMEATNG